MMTQKRRRRRNLRYTKKLIVTICSAVYAESLVPLYMLQHLKAQWGPSLNSVSIRNRHMKGLLESVCLSYIDMNMIIILPTAVSTFICPDPFGASPGHRGPYH